MNNKRGFTPLESYAIYGGDDMRNISHPFKNGAVKISPFLTGFTLVEVVVSMVILATVVSGFMASFVATQRFISRSYRRLQAANYCREVFEVLKDGVNADYWQNGAGAFKLDLKIWTDCTADLGINLANLAAFGGQCQYQVEQAVGQPVGGYRKVTVRLRWTEP